MVLYVCVTIYYLYVMTVVYVCWGHIFVIHMNGPIFKVYEVFEKFKFATYFQGNNLVVL